MTDPGVNGIAAGGVGRAAPGDRTALASLAAVQAAYYVATGAAPFVSMRIFERITGPKTDRWLVRTVGLLAVGFGVVLARDGVNRRPDPVTGLAAALPFALSSGWYGATGRVSRVYLLDAAAEGAFALAWAAAVARGRTRRDS